MLGQPAHGDDEVDGIAGGDAAFAADAQLELGADPGLHAEAHRDRVPVVAAGNAGDAALADALDEERRVAGGAAARIVRDVGDHHRPAVDRERPVERLVHAEEGRPRGLAQPEDLLAQRSRQRRGLGPVAVGHHQRLHADIGDVGPGKGVAERNRQDAVAPFQRVHPVDEAAHRLLGWTEGSDHAAVEHRHLRPRPALRGVGDQGEQVLGALGDVDMRVFLVGDQHRGAPQHGLGEVAMQIELGADRHRRADDGADPAEDVAFAIVIALGGHRAVQREDDHVDRHRPEKVVEQLVAQRLVGRPHDAPARLGEGAQALDHRPAARLRPAPPDEELGRAVIGVLARRVAMGEKAIGEALIAGRNRRERVGLGVETGNEDFHAGGSGCSR